VRIHLGHHFYGAGNLGDDFMLAGFLGAMRSLAPSATFTCCVPFELGPLRQRFPAVNWLPYDPTQRARCIHECNVWLGLGGSPFQSALSRWFVDHLVTEAELCAHDKKPMFFLGVGVQSARELDLPEVRRLCANATTIWTRDIASAEQLRAVPGSPPIEAAADLAHVFFRDLPPPAARARRLTFVPNFDYGAWPAQSEFLEAARGLAAEDNVWLAQEARELPGSELALYRALPESEQSRWRLVSLDESGSALSHVVSRWPSAEWLVTARYHAALAGAWAGSKIVVLSTNEKLRAIARELHAPLVAPDADAATFSRAIHAAGPTSPPHVMAEQAFGACAAFVRSAVAHGR
jgi:hypothetical protein